MTIPQQPLLRQSGRRLHLGAANVGGTLGSTAIVLLFVGTANVLTGRMLGVEGQGRVAAATLVPMIVAYVGELGLPVSTGYLVGTASYDRSITIATARHLARSLSLFLVPLSLGLITILPLDASARGIAYFFSAFVILSLFYRLHLSILQVDFRFKAYNLVKLSGATAYLGVLILLAVANWATETRVVAALLFANVVWVALAVRLTYTPPAFSFHSETAKRLVSYGLRAHVGNVSSVDSLRVDQLVLATFLGPRELGLYVAAITIITGNRVIGTALGALCFPLASRRGDGQSPAWRQFQLILALTVGLSLAVAAVEIWLGGRLLGALFGADFSAGGRVLQILAVGSVFMNVRQVCADWLRGCGRPGIVTVAELVSILALGLLATLMWDGSVEPVALAISLSALVAFVWLLGGVALSPPRRP